MISVIIPTLNEENYIERTLKSVKKQSHKGSIEIIVADGGSVDRTLEIARKYTDKIIKVKKRGIAAGRNAGANVARGVIVVFVDADTLLLPNVLDDIASAFDDKSVIGVAPAVYSEDAGFKNRLSYWLFYRFSKTSTKLGRPFLGGMCVAYRKDAFEGAGGFDENLKSGEDLDLSFRMSRYGTGRFKLLDGSYAFTSARRLDRWGWQRFLYEYFKTYVLGKYSDTIGKHYNDGEYTPVR